MNLIDDPVDRLSEARIALILISLNEKVKNLEYRLGAAEEQIKFLTFK